MPQSCASVMHPPHNSLSNNAQTRAFSKRTLEIASDRWKSGFGRDHADARNAGYLIDQFAKMSNWV